MHWRDAQAPELGRTVHMRVRFIKAQDTWSLRHRVLRPHQTIEDCGTSQTTATRTASIWPSSSGNTSSVPVPSMRSGTMRSRGWKQYRFLRHGHAPGFPRQGAAPGWSGSRWNTCAPNAPHLLQMPGSARGASTRSWLHSHANPSISTGSAGISGCNNASERGIPAGGKPSIVYRTVPAGHLMYPAVRGSARGDLSAMARYHEREHVDLPASACIQRDSFRRGRRGRAVALHAYAIPGAYPSRSPKHLDMVRAPSVQRPGCLAQRRSRRISSCACLAVRDAQVMADAAASIIPLAATSRCTAPCRSSIRLLRAFPDEPPRC